MGGRCPHGDVTHLRVVRREPGEHGLRRACCIECGLEDPGVVQMALTLLLDEFPDMALAAGMWNSLHRWAVDRAREWRHEDQRGFLERRGLLQRQAMT